MPAVSTRGLGWLPDVPSIKDYTENSAEVSTLLTRTQVSSRVGSVSTKGGGRASAAAAAPALSPTVDLRAFCSPIEDQQALGSCTANAAAGLVEYFEKRASGRYIDASRLFIYKATRNLLGLTGDTGVALLTTDQAGAGPLSPASAIFRRLLTASAFNF